MTGYSLASMTLEFTYPEGIRTHRLSPPSHSGVRATITRAVAMRTYPLRDYEALINGHTITLNGVEIREVKQ